MSSFEGENIQIQHKDLGYRINLYFNEKLMKIVVVTKILTMQ